MITVEVSKNKSGLYTGYRAKGTPTTRRRGRVWYAPGFLR